MSRAADPKPSPRPIWARRPGETFAQYVERYHEEIATPAELVSLEAAAREGRVDVVDDAPDDPER